MHEEKSVLFLGAAKRVSMARKFKAAAERRGIRLNIYDSETLSPVPIQSVATVIDRSDWRSPDIVRSMSQLCSEYNICAVIPFLDPAVALAARIAEASYGKVFAPTCSATQAEQMFDKVVANEIFASAGISVPPNYIPGQPFPQYPLLAKPRHGSASKGLIMIDRENDLALIAGNPADYLVQRRYDRRREFTVDCYVGVSDGTVCAVVPRVRDAVAGGEVTHTTVVHDSHADALARQVLAATGLRGAVTVQLIQDLDSGTMMVMEVNPRLGGGAVAAVCAGADIPGMIIDEALGIKPKPTAEYTNIIVTRYLDEVAFPY